MLKNLKFIWPLALLLAAIVSQTLWGNLIFLSSENRDTSEFDIVVAGEINPLGEGYFPNGFSYFVSTVFIRENIINDALGKGADQICVSGISQDIKHRLLFFGESNIGLHNLDPKPEACVDLSDPRFHEGVGIGISTREDAGPFIYYDSAGYAFFFPFDFHEVVWSPTVEIALYSDDEIIYSFTENNVHHTTGSLRSDHWIFIHNTDNTTRIIRPLLMIILVPVTLIIFVLASTLLPSIQNLGTAAEVAISLVVGLFTVSQLLIPEIHDVPLLVDYVVIGAILVIFLGLFHVYGTNVEEAQAPIDPHSPVGDCYSIIGSSVYHKKDCRYLRGVDPARVQSAVEHDRLDLSPCEICIT